MLVTDCCGGCGAYVTSLSAALDFAATMGIVLNRNSEWKAAVRAAGLRATAADMMAAQTNVRAHLAFAQGAL